MPLTVIGRRFPLGVPSVTVPEPAVTDADQTVRES